MKSFSLVLGLALLAATGARAQAEPAPVAASAASSEAIVVTRDTAAAAPGDSGCLRATGTRLAKRDRKGCTGDPGQSYSRADIDRSGANDTADAIRRLSPRANVRRGG